MQDGEMNKFSTVNFQNYAPKYYLENEEGTCKITGDKITITPRTASFSSHKLKKEDLPIKSGNLRLEIAQYSFEIINLNNSWSLLLSPVDGNETKRDRAFGFVLNGEARKKDLFLQFRERQRRVDTSSRTAMNSQPS